MNWVEWAGVIFAGLVVYSVGFVAMVAVIARTCKRYSHRACNHVWGTPIPAMWPLAVALGLAVAPLAVPLFIVTRVSLKVDRRIVARRIAERERCDMR